MVGAAEIAWAAGLFEGEGSIIINGRHTKWPRLQLQLSSTDRDVVERFHGIVGEGTVRFRKRQREHWKDQWSWRATSRPAERVADALEPWLGARRAERLNQLRQEVVEMRYLGSAHLW